MLCVPADRDGTAKVAIPEAFSMAVPRVVEPSESVTVPVGVPEDPLTCAVNVTG